MMHYSYLQTGILSTFLCTLYLLNYVLNELLSSNDFKQQHRGLPLLRRDIWHDVVIGKRIELRDQ